MSLFVIVFDFWELHSIFVVRIVGVHVTLSYNVKRMFQLSINIFICIYTSMTLPTVPLCPTVPLFPTGLTLPSE